MTGPLRPVLLSTEEREDLARLLEHVATFDPGGFAADARRLGHLLADEERTGGEVAYTYGLAGPWGSHGMDSEAQAIAECRAARAEHWAEGWGRDERYASIGAYRVPHVSFDIDDSEWVGGGEVIDVPDAPLAAAEQAESDARIERAAQRQAAIYAHLRDAMTPDRGDLA